MLHDSVLAQGGRALNKSGTQECSHMLVRCSFSPACSLRSHLCALHNTYHILRGFDAPHKTVEQLLLPERLPQVDPPTIENNRYAHAPG